MAAAGRESFRPMRWFYNWRFGNWLAPAALALQLVLSFGHVHLDGVHRTHPTLVLSGSAAQASPLGTPRD
jgi:hypothetical protein